MRRTKVLSIAMDFKWSNAYGGRFGHNGSLAGVPDVKLPQFEVRPWLIHMVINKEILRHNRDGTVTLILDGNR